MASNSADETAGGSLPPALIAQAEAAIIGNAEEDSPISRQPSNVASNMQYSYRLKPTSSKSQGSQSAITDNNTSAILPPYSDRPNELELSQDGFDTQANVTDDGRVDIKIVERSRRLSNLLIPALRSQISLVSEEEQRPLPPGFIPPALGGSPGQQRPPKLNVVMHVVGSRGDIQPFIALGKTLQKTYGHRVRLATHPVFQSFVEENGLEFFSIGGDPAELMAFMVKNPGLMPGLETLKSGDVGKRRKNIEEMVLGCWRSCIEAGKGNSPAPNYEDGGINMDTEASDRPFIADAIIANPPSFAHVHIAEKLGIPLHIMFTMPWSPTQSFPHPLANIQSSNADINMTNFMSYALVEMMTWQGLGDIINRFREKALGLDPISLIWAPGMLTRLRIPFTYCWSPAIIPKPKDWGQQISISGFFFLSLASTYTPEPELAAFLAAGPPPVYIGFGSIVVDDPNAMTRLIFDAIKISRKTDPQIRYLVSKGWGGLGADSLDIPEMVFMLGNVPHDWLFKHVSCCVHHGGAGTTAAGVALGKPTVVVPFFGDQPFWGAMVARSGAGPVPVPYKILTAEKLAESILEALKPATLERAKELGAKITEEKGTEVAGKAFHDHLDVENLRCSFAPSRAAVWRIKRTKTRLSALAATVLSNEGLLSFSDLKLYRSREYNTDEGPWDPISGGASALIGTLASMGMGAADIPHEIFKGLNRKVKERSWHPENPASRSSSEGARPNSGSQANLSETIARNSVDLDSATSSAQNSLDITRQQNEPQSPTTLTPSSRISSFTSRGNSLKEAFREHREHRRASSRSSSPSRLKKEIEPSELNIEGVVGAGKGISRIIGSGLKSPLDFTLGIARGFHNAPKLYGDDTVRPQERVIDFSSGLKAAGKEFGYGMYDGFSGLITQPVRGAQKDGPAGLLKGLGRGFAGLVLKPGAAFWGLPGYTMMGIHKEIRSLFGSSVQNYIISARTAKGYEDFQSSTLEERQEIINKWQTHKTEYQNMRQKILEEGPDGQYTGHLSPKGFLQTRHLTFDERKKLRAERHGKREEESSKSPKTRRGCPFCHKQSAHKHNKNHVGEYLEHDEELERAITKSVAVTSEGNIQQDAEVEKAIRATIAELEKSPSLTESEAMERVVYGSPLENADTSPEDEDAEYNARLEKSIHLSLQESQNSQTTFDVNSDEDEDMQKAIEESKKSVSHEVTDEERIVLEYVKKQSLAEEEHKRAMQNSQQEIEGSAQKEDNANEEENHEVKRAIEKKYEV